MATTPLAILTLALLGAAPASAAAPSAAPAPTLHEITVNVRQAGLAHYVTIAWTAQLKSDPGASALTLDAVCRIKDKDVRSTKAFAMDKVYSTGGAPMKQSILSRGKPSWCEIQFQWGPPAKEAPKQELAKVCWTNGATKGEAKTEPGPCKRQ